MKNPEDKKKESEEPAPNRLQKYSAILLLALIVVVLVDGYFGNWSIFRTLVALNTLQLRDKSDHTWELVERRDFQLVNVSDVRTLVNADSLLAFDRMYREAGFYRLYFRTSDSSSTKLQKMYQALLDLDTSQTIKHTVEDAQRAYQNLQGILHSNRPGLQDTLPRASTDTAMKIAKSDVSLGAGDETMAVVRKIVSDPHVLAGLGIGVVASAGIDLLRGDAYLAISKEDLFRIDSLKVGSRVGLWESHPIDILWVFSRQDTAGRGMQREGKSRDGKTDR